MGTEEKSEGIRETVASEAMVLAVEVYKDAARPALAAVGGTLGVTVHVGHTMPMAIEWRSVRCSCAAM